MSYRAKTGTRRATDAEIEETVRRQKEATDFYKQK